MPIVVDLDVEMVKRKMNVTQLCQRVGITPANLSVLKNGRARAVRFSTLSALCGVLDCQPGDLLRYIPDEEESHQVSASTAADADADATGVPVRRGERP